MCFLVRPQKNIVGSGLTSRLDSKEKHPEICSGIEIDKQPAWQNDTIITF